MTEQDWRDLYARLGVEPALARIMLAAVLSEGGLTAPYPPGDDGHARGPYQIHDLNGARDLTGVDRDDPESATRYLLKAEYRTALAEGQVRGYAGEQLARWTYMRAERPLGWQGPAAPGLDTAAANAFAAHWSAVSDTPPTPNAILAEATNVKYARCFYRLDPPPDGVLTLDCSLYVLQVFEACGLPFPAGVRTAEQIRQVCAAVDWDDLRPGDLLFFENTYPTPGASHIGISLGKGSMQMYDCHERAGSACGLTNLGGDYWQQHLLSAGRWGAADPTEAPPVDPEVAAGAPTPDDLTNLVGYLQGDVADAIAQAIGSLQAALATLRKAGKA